MDQWSFNPPPDDDDPYAPDCSSRAAEGFYVGALYGAVWGLTGRAASTSIFPSNTPVAGSFSQLSTALPLQSGVGGGKLPVADYLRAFGRGVTGYSVSAVSTAGVFGVFLGVVNAGTCACERFRGERDWVNNMLGGGAAGFSVAMLSRHTRTPRIVLAHAVGAAAITSAVAIARGRPAAG